MAATETCHSNPGLYKSPLISDTLKAAFEVDGYVILRGFLSREETDVLVKVAKSDSALMARSYHLDDGEGGRARLALWNEVGDDVFGAIARCDRLVDAVEVLLGDEVYHYHSKMSIKEPRIGGSFAWHQDYGYWYKNGCLYPDMASVMVAVDPNTKLNGCLQLIKGSHRLGRVEHGRFGDQTCADPERVEQVLKRLDIIYAELEPGDALIFHCNVLHRSDQNQSPNPRWSLLCCYNTRHNDPYKKSHHPQYTKLIKVPASGILKAGQDALSGKSKENWGAYMDPAIDMTIRDGVQNKDLSVLN